MNPIRTEWTLKELAEKSGVPERTIRFYIARGLLDPPLRAGRGAAYGREHLDRLDDIRARQAKGMMLSDIANSWQTLDEHAFSARPKTIDLTESCALHSDRGAPLPEPERWNSYQLSPDVCVMLRPGAPPWKMKRILAATRRFAQELTLSVENQDE